MGLPRSIKWCPAIGSDIIVGDYVPEYGHSQRALTMKASVLFLQNGKEKIIGARTFSLQSYNKFSAKDTSGHGTHVVSIISGREVIDSSYYGIAKGIARGGVPSTRIAAYKVCYHINCYDVDVLRAFDHAIADGVDIISVSIARPNRVVLTFDPIAIGAFHAMEKGILTVNAAGNC
ncbi:putative cucumisin [Helianthus annuus]|uniref:Cucumisin n=1 Tax=Helianthus annuus TaxID=4232 RepID=A0A9K3HJP4_HELAN|nr:putative cucumisin [Helianthus annuus]